MDSIYIVVIFSYLFQSSALTVWLILMANYDNGWRYNVQIFETCKQLNMVCTALSAHSLPSLKRSSLMRYSTLMNSIIEICALNFNCGWWLFSLPFPFYEHWTLIMVPHWRSVVEVSDPSKPTHCWINGQISAHVVSKECLSTAQALPKQTKVTKWCARSPLVAPDNTLVMPESSLSRGHVGIGRYT